MDESGCYSDPRPMGRSRGEGTVRLFAAVYTGLLSVFLTGCDGAVGGYTGFDSVHDAFSVDVIDSSGPMSPWGKAVGDINGDGLPDIVVGGHQPRQLTLAERGLRKIGLDHANRKGELVWYENPTWQRHVVSEQFAIRTDIEVVDIDGDGRNDLVAVTDQGVVWFANGQWQASIVGGGKFHDIESADLDGDGSIELIVRNQTLFGYENGHFVRVFDRTTSGQWQRRDFIVPHGEGLAIADINRDGWQDIVVNRVWLRNPGAEGAEYEWQVQEYGHSHEVDGTWSWPHVYIDTADLNRDGYPDILLAPAEEAGKYYDIAWFLNPGDRRAQGVGHSGGKSTGESTVERAAASGWEKLTVASGVEAVHHFVSAGDADGDGDIDVFAAEMNQGEGDNPVSLYRNVEGEWRQEVLSYGGGHSLQMADIDGDFDLDLVGTNWEFQHYAGDYPVRIWRNFAADSPSWSRYEIDQKRPGQATAVLVTDLNGDGLCDIVTGAYWYRNPGQLDGRWGRAELGAPAYDAIYAGDVDRDGDQDVIATGWFGYHHQQSLVEDVASRLAGDPAHPGNHGRRIALAENIGGGEFSVRVVAEASEGDFTQGVAALETGKPDTWSLVLSWHEEGTGLHELTRRNESGREIWHIRRLTDDSQSEAVNASDLDRDGRMDLALGTIWLRGTDRGFVPMPVDSLSEKPDRNAIADVDGDGWSDIIIGFEAVSRIGDVTWYQNPGVGSEWRPSRIASLVGPMSLDVADLTGDGWPDVVVGEHNLANPAGSRLVWFRNIDQGKAWQGNLIHIGDEHHDGAKLADLDNDGDLDIVSIGWSHGRVLIYENPGL